MKIVLILFIFGITKIECGILPVELTKLNETPFPIDADELDRNYNVIERNAKIVYGQQAKYGQFPHFALIYVSRPNAVVQCGAGLISSRWTLSANHCVDSAVAIELRFGVMNRNLYEQKLMASAFARSPNSDLSLILLSTDVQITVNVRPALLPKMSEAYELHVAELATVCGLGIDNVKMSSVSQYLQYATLKIISNDECGRTYGTMGVETVCAIGDSNNLSSTCPGDSGSPLVVYENSQPVIIGVVSFGAASGCDQGYPVGYARITKQLDFIKYFSGIYRA